MPFVPFKGFVNDYEILNKYPFTISNKKTRKPLKDSDHNDRYLTVSLKGVNYLKHALIAKQFIHNDDPTHKKVDHKPRNRKDNRLCNLRWVTHSKNNYNRKILSKMCTIFQKI